MNSYKEELNPDSVKELTRSLFLINNVHKQLEEEREHITTAAAQMTFVSKEFQNSTQKMTEKINNLDSMTKSIISREMGQMSRSIVEEVSRSMIETLTKKYQEEANKLLQITRGCEEQINKATKKLNFFSRWFVASVLGATLIGGVLGGAIIHYTFPKMDQEMLNQLTYGATFKELWSKLTEKEKEKLKAINSMQPRK